MWWDGRDQAPECVRVCLESQKRHFSAARFNYHILDKDTVWQYVDLPYSGKEKFNAGKMALTNLSDVIRTR